MRAIYKVFNVITLLIFSFSLYAQENLPKIHTANPSYTIFNGKVYDAGVIVEDEQGEKVIRKSVDSEQEPKVIYQIVDNQFCAPKTSEPSESDCASSMLTMIDGIVYFGKVEKSEQGKVIFSQDKGRENEEQTEPVKYLTNINGNLYPFGTLKTHWGIFSNRIEAEVYQQLNEMNVKSSQSGPNIVEGQTRPSLSDKISEFMKINSQKRYDKAL